jgi:hypothetical protein
LAVFPVVEKPTATAEEGEEGEGEFGKIHNVKGLQVYGFTGLQVYGFRQRWIRECNGVGRPLS